MCGAWAPAPGSSWIGWKYTSRMVRFATRTCRAFPIQMPWGTPPYAALAMPRPTSTTSSHESVLPRMATFGTLVLTHRVLVRW